MASALQVVSGRALNDVQTWARDSMALEDSRREKSITVRQGSGSQEFGCTDSTCDIKFIDSWKVTGGTAELSNGGPQSQAINLETTLKEGRVSITLTSSLYKSLANPLRSIASRSQLVTGRYLDQPPYFVVTALNDINSDVELKGASEGDTGGVSRFQKGHIYSGHPTVSDPAGFTRTTLESESTCSNSADAQSADPKRDVPTSANIPTIPNHSYAPNEKLVWIYEGPCVTPGLVPDPKDSPSPDVDVQSTGEYLHSGSATVQWSKGDVTSGSP